MKKLLFGIGICVLFVAASCNKQKQVLLAPSGKTLNGIPGGEANTMVTNFINNPGVYDKNTHANIWFSRPVFASMYKYLKDNNGNGMRIYFAKNTGTNKNSIVIVSTRANSTGTINVDFFQDPSYPTSADLRGVNSYDSTNGALLYTDKPVLPKDDGCDSSDNHYISNEKAYLMVNNYGVDQINDTSEWFDVGLFQAFARDKNYDGIRIYFATKTAGSTQPGSDAFVIIKTVSDRRQIHMWIILVVPRWLYGHTRLQMAGRMKGNCALTIVMCPDNCS